MSHGSHDAPTFAPEDLEIPAGHAWTRIPVIGLVLGVVGLIGSLVLARQDAHQFYFSWLVAFMFFLSIALGGGSLAFTFTGLVIGSVIYSLPFVVQPLQDAFNSVGKRPLEVAATLGAKPLDRFFTVALPLARPGYLTATVLGFAHTLGEFGVVLMIGGNLPGATRVLSISIYEHVEVLEYGKAHLLSGVLLAFRAAKAIELEAVTFSAAQLSADTPSTTILGLHFARSGPSRFTFTVTVFAAPGLRVLCLMHMLLVLATPITPRIRTPLGWPDALTVAQDMCRASVGRTNCSCSEFVTLRDTE